MHRRVSSALVIATPNGPDKFDAIIPLEAPEAEKR